MAIQHKHKGTSGELRAVVWLLDQGYDVFRNVSPYGEVDLVALKDGISVLIDVKTIGYVVAYDGEKVWSAPPTSDYKDNKEVRMLCISSLTGECAWAHDIEKFRNDNMHRLPPRRNRK